MSSTNIKPYNHPLFFISDLHIGDGSGRDDFYDNHKAFTDFLRYVQRENGRIYCGGDIFELVQCKWNKITSLYSWTTETLLDLTDGYVLGNHDKKVPLYLPENAPPTIKTRWLDEDNRFLLLHGNEFDKWNTWGTRKGDIITKAWGLVEDLIPSFDLPEKLWRNDAHYAKDCALEGWRTKVPVVIFGHTHHAFDGYYDLAQIGYTHNENRFIRIMNMGCWVNGHSDYIRMDENGFQLLSWG